MFDLKIKLLLQPDEFDRYIYMYFFNSCFINIDINNSFFYK